MNNDKVRELEEQLDQISELLGKQPLDYVVIPDDQYLDTFRTDPRGVGRLVPVIRGLKGAVTIYSNYQYQVKKEAGTI